jgi:hypothetical protein
MTEPTNITITPDMRAEILNLIHALADIALEGNENATEVDEMCERINNVVDVLSENE